MQSGERKLHLRLDTGDAHHPAAGGVLGEVVQQRRLAHARLAAHHQGAALASTYRVQEPVQHVAFPAPAQQLRGALPLTGRSVSVRDRHYARLQHAAVWPAARRSCSAISIEASMGNLLIEGQPK